MLTGKMSSRWRSRHTRPSSLAVRGDWGRDATNAALRAPTEAPTRKSAVMPSSYSASSIPTCNAPRLAPPERTNAVRGPEAPVVGRLRGRSSAAIVIALPRSRRPRSWRVPERVAKRVGRVDRRNAEGNQSVGPGVSDDDLGLPGGAIPLEPHREPVAVSRVKFDEHRATPISCGDHGYARRGLRSSVNSARRGSEKGDGWQVLGMPGGNDPC